METQQNFEFGTKFGIFRKNLEFLQRQFTWNFERNFYRQMNTL